MRARSVTKSKKQYVQGLNTPAKAVVRDLPEAAGAPMPGFIEPCLATLWPKPPSGDKWISEIKFDGYRFQLHKHESDIRLYTRRGHDWTHKCGGIARAAFHLNTHSAILDGEVVVVSPDGTTDFNELERELGRKDSDRLTFFVFDLLYLDGLDLRRVPLLSRKEALMALMGDLPQGGAIKYSEHVPWCVREAAARRLQD